MFQLMIVALLESGAPQRLEDIAERLELAGASSPIGDMVASLRKAWKRREPVYEDEAGRVALNVASQELDLIVFRLALRPPKVRHTPIANAAVVLPGDEVPLSVDELRAAFARPSLWGQSGTRLCAAVLDAHGRAMTATEVDGFLDQLVAHRPGLPLQFRSGAAKLVVALPDGRLALDLASRSLGPMRRATRKLAEPELKRRLQEKNRAAARVHAQAVLAADRERQRTEASRLRRVLLHVIPEAGTPAAAVLLDLHDRRLDTFIGPALTQVVPAVRRYDLVAGLAVRDSLHRLDVASDPFRIVELGPSRKSIRLNQRGHMLPITAHLVVSGTTGSARGLGDPAKVAEYLAQDATDRLVRRIESDAKALFDLYTYARLHRGLRIRWGFVDELLGVDWPVPGDETAYELLELARDQGREVLVVTGTAPGWEEPEARARRGRVFDLGPHSFTLHTGDTAEIVARRDIQALRLL
jgi:hypothetical protein